MIEALIILGALVIYLFFRWKVWPPADFPSHLDKRSEDGKGGRFWPE